MLWKCELHLLVGLASYPEAEFFYLFIRVGLGWCVNYDGCVIQVWFIHIDDNIFSVFFKLCLQLMIRWKDHINNKIPDIHPGEFQIDIGWSSFFIFTFKYIIQLLFQLTHFLIPPFLKMLSTKIFVLLIDISEQLTSGVITHTFDYLRH